MTADINQDCPVPQPCVRADVNFNTPNDLGPSILGHNIFSGFNLNVIFDWQAGYRATYDPMGISHISYNVQSVDYFNLALRLNKIISFGKIRIQFFVDIDNAMDMLRLWIPPVQTSDYQNYMESLHLPKSEAYTNIPGNDRIGDYRKPGTDWQPIVHVGNLNLTGVRQDEERAWFYEDASHQYYQWTNGRWSIVDQQQLKKVLDNKAYIDMPNASTFWFLNPRKIFFGLRVSFDIGE